MPAPPSRYAPRLHSPKSPPEAPKIPEGIRVAPAPSPTSDNAGGGPACNSEPASSSVSEEAPPPQGGYVWRWYKSLERQEEATFLFPLWIYRRQPQRLCGAGCVVILGILAAVLLGAAPSVPEYSVSYRTGDTSKLIDIETDISAPALFSYQIPHFYSNRKQYIENKDNFIVGSLISRYECTDAKERDVAWRRPGDAGFAALLNGRYFRPCGLVALSMFTDTFQLENTATNQMIILDEKNVALPKDPKIYEPKILKGPDGLTIEGKKSWLREGSFYEHFMVWYRQPPSPHVRNLWATIPGGLKAGKYKVHLTNNSAVWTSQWEVPEKIVTIGSAHKLGNQGALTVLGVLCVVFGSLQLIMTCALIMLPGKGPA